MQLYHGSVEKIIFPEIRKTPYTKDFSWGFYCTNNYEQSYRSADRKLQKGFVNVFNYTENTALKILKFERMTDEWLDFINNCRAGYIHDYDIVEGPMADDTVWNFVNDFLSKNISREAFWKLVKFKNPAHQISFHTIRALDCLTFERSEEVNE